MLVKGDPGVNMKVLQNIFGLVDYIMSFIFSFYKVNIGLYDGLGKLGMVQFSHQCASEIFLEYSKCPSLWIWSDS